MPDISYQMKLLEGMQDVRNPNSTMGALDRLGSSIGNAWQGYQGRTDEQDAIKFFMEKPVSPETIQEFSSAHPQMPLMDVYKTAGTLATQKKGQQAKDYFTSLQSYLAGGGEPDPEKFQEIASKYPSLNPKEIMDMTNGIMTQTDFMATVKEKKKARENLEGYRKTIGGLTEPVTKVTAGTLADNPEDMSAVTETTTPKLDLNKTLSAILQYQAPKEASETLVHIATLQKGKEPSVWIMSTDGKTKQFVTPEAAGILVNTGAFTKYDESKESGLAYHIEKESVGDKLTQDYRVFVDKQGNVTKREKMGVPYKNTEGVAEVRIAAGFNPQQTQLTDPESGKPLIFDKKAGVYRIAEVEGGGGIAPRPVNPSAAEREKTAGLATIKDQLKVIKDTYAEHPEYVGVVSGQAGRISQLWNAPEAGFRQKILDVKDSLLRARSGAQINEQEFKRLSKLVPDMGDSGTMFEGKMASFEQSLDMMTQNRAAAQKTGGVFNRPSGGPKVGDVQKGYRFKGGNPADKNAWEKI